MGRSAVAVAVLVLAVSTLAASPALGAVSGDTALAQPEGFDRTVFDVTVYENATAEWVFEHRRVLADDGERRDFEAYAETFESTETTLYSNFVNQSETLAQVGAQQTGREMVASGHARSASVDNLGQTEGVVQLSFEWTQFAEDTEGGVLVADVFEGGLVLGENQRIVFDSGDDVAFESVQPDDFTPSGENVSTSDSVTFFGPLEFADMRPRVEFVRTGPMGGSMATGPETNLAVFVALLVIVLGTVAALAWRFGLLPPTRGEAQASENATVAGSQPKEVKSDNDRVLQLLRNNGGRMKQVNIVEETDWSKSKVSMLLSDMEEGGEITKLRVGRENIVSLAGQEPDAAGSPFEEEE